LMAAGGKDDSPGRRSLASSHACSNQRFRIPDGRWKTCLGSRVSIENRQTQI
jgi:hypothetical protein